MHFSLSYHGNMHKSTGASCNKMLNFQVCQGDETLHADKLHKTCQRQISAKAFPLHIMNYLLEWEDSSKCIQHADMAGEFSISHNLTALTPFGEATTPALRLHFGETATLRCAIKAATVPGGNGGATTSFGSA